MGCGEAGVRGAYLCLLLGIWRFDGDGLRIDA